MFALYFSDEKGNFLLKRQLKYIQEEEKVPMKQELEKEIVFKIEREAVNRFKEKSEKKKL